MERIPPSISDRLEAYSVDAASLQIVRYPHPALRVRTKPMPPEAITSPHVRRVAERMIELMHKAPGVGLAAPQVGLPWRMFVLDISAQEETDEYDRRSPDDDPPTATRGPVVCINPRFTKPEGGLDPYEEGCLSLPKIYGDVLRPPLITLTATGLDGVEFVQTGAGLLARCWQHETDHLDGVLIIDKMTQIYRMKNRAAIRDLERA